MSQSLVYIVSIRHRPDKGEQIRAARDQHYAALAPFFESGELVIGGRLAEGGGGYLIGVAARPDLVERLRSVDPFIQQGLADYEIESFIPTNVAASLSAVATESR